MNGTSLKIVMPTINFKKIFFYVAILCSSPPSKPVVIKLCHMLKKTTFTQINNI